LDGALLWRHEFPTAVYSLAWDGAYIYASLVREARRWTPDGVEDDWRFETQGSVHALAVSDSTVAVIGSYVEQDDWGDGYSDAYYSEVSKTMPQVLLDGGVQATEGAFDYATSVVRSPRAGWIVVGDVSEPGSVWLRGLGADADEVSVDLEPGKSPHVVSIVALDDEVLVSGWTSSAHGMWLSAVSADGEELWRENVRLCGDAGGSIGDLVERDGVLWGRGSVRTGANAFAPLLVQLRLDGAIANVWAVRVDGEFVDVDAVSVGAAGIYLGGSSLGADQARYRFLARVTP
jgi:hypothetical protein